MNDKFSAWSNSPLRIPTGLLLMKLRIAATCLALSTVTGCALIDAMNEMALQEYQRRCDSFGFQRGTEAYSDCLLKQQAIDEILSSISR
jgi:hypothetical protein